MIGAMEKAMRELTNDPKYINIVPTKISMELDNTETTDKDGNTITDIIIGIEATNMFVLDK